MIATFTTSNLVTERAMMPFVVGQEGPEISVVVPTRDRPDGLRRLVRALEAQTLDRTRWSLTIVDDCSGDPTKVAIEELTRSSQLRIFTQRTDRSEGPARARNLGWRNTSGPYLAFTDDDCVPHPDWLRAGLAALERSHGVGVVQGRTVRPPQSDCYPYRCTTVVREVLEPSPWFESCNIFFRRAAVEEAGGFEENVGRFGGWFAEDTSLGWSIVDAGWDRAWADDAVVEHELSERPWRWHIEKHYLEGHLVRVAATHPAIRSMFWQPWAVKRENALFALAVAGLIIGTKWRPALLLGVPYARWAPRPWPTVESLQGFTHQVACHTASLAGKIVASTKYHEFLL